MAVCASRGRTDVCVQRAGPGRVGADALTLGHHPPPALPLLRPPHGRGLGPGVAAAPGRALAPVRALAPAIGSRCQPNRK